MSHLDSSCSNNWRSKCSFAKYWGSFETDVASGTSNYIHFYKPQVEALTKEMFYDPQANNQWQKQVQILKFHLVPEVLYKRNHLRVFHSDIFQMPERCLNCRKIPFTLSHLISGFNNPTLWCKFPWENLWTNLKKQSQLIKTRTTTKGIYKEERCSVVFSLWKHSNTGRPDKPMFSPQAFFFPGCCKSRQRLRLLWK